MDGNLKQTVADMEARLAEIEEWRKSVDAMTIELQELNALMRDVRGALKVFIAAGNAIKWFVGLAAAVAAIGYGVKHWVVQ